MAFSAGLPFLLLVWHHFYGSSSLHWKLYSHASSGRCIRGHLTCLSCVCGTSASWNMTVCARIYHSTKLSLETSLSPEELEVQAAQILANRAERKRVASRAAYAQAKSNDPEALQVSRRRSRESMLRKTLPRSKQLATDTEQRPRSRGNGTVPFVTTRATNRLR